MTDPEKPKTLLEALLAVQKEVPYLRLGKDSKGQVAGNRDYRYLSLDKLMDEVLPLLSRHGLVWVTMPGQDDNGRPVLDYMLVKSTHTDAKPEQIRGRMPLMLDKPTSQALGSAITYARRYSLASVLGLTPDEDDDGAEASKPAAAPQRASEAKTAKLSETDRILTDEEQNLLAEAVRKADQKLGLLLASEGVEDVDQLTVQKGRNIFRKLDTSLEGGPKGTAV